MENNTTSPVPVYIG